MRKSSLKAFGYFFTTLKRRVSFFSLTSSTSNGQAVFRLVVFENIHLAELVREPRRAGEVLICFGYGYYLVGSKTHKFFLFHCVSPFA